MKVWWFRGDLWTGSVGNFGDWLTPYFLHKLTKLKFGWAREKEADLFGCGSILEGVPKDFKGILLTTGAMNEGTIRHDLSGAQILGLRGRLTFDRIKGEDPVSVRGPLVIGPYAPFGDLGLLCRLFAPKVTVKYKVGMIPHYVHREQAFPDMHVIQVCSGIEHVMREAAKCERIVSSSLHGIILADALGIENKWEFSNDVLGKGFKFRDYVSAFGEEIEPGQWRLGNQERIGQIAEELKEIIERL